MLTLGEQDVNGARRNLSTELTAAKHSFYDFGAEVKKNGSKQWIGKIKFIFHNIYFNYPNYCP